MDGLGGFVALKTIFQSAVCLGLMLVTVGSLFAVMLVVIFGEHDSFSSAMKIYGFLAASTLVSGILSFRMVRQRAYHQYDAIALLILSAAWYLII
jgi:predicted membrane protein